MYFLLDKLRNSYEENQGKIKCTKIIYIDDFRIFFSTPKRICMSKIRPKMKNSGQN